jgi:hypothetical protein
MEREHAVAEAGVKDVAHYPRDAFEEGSIGFKSVVKLVGGVY